MSQPARRAPGSVVCVLVIGEGPAREPGDAWSCPDGITRIGAPADLVGGVDPAEMGVSDI